MSNVSIKARVSCNCVCAPRACVGGMCANQKVARRRENSHFQVSKQQRSRFRFSSSFPLSISSVARQIIASIPARAPLQCKQTRVPAEVTIAGTPRVNSSGRACGLASGRSQMAPECGECSLPAVQQVRCGGRETNLPLAIRTTDRPDGPLGVASGNLRTPRE